VLSGDKRQVLRERASDSGLGRWAGELAADLVGKLGAAKRRPD